MKFLKQLYTNIYNKKISQSYRTTHNNEYKEKKKREKHQKQKLKRDFQKVNEIMKEKHGFSMDQRAKKKKK